jgi:hypothetical protein
MIVSDTGTDQKDLDGAKVRRLKLAALSLPDKIHRDHLWRNQLSENPFAMRPFALAQIRAVVEVLRL